MLIEFSVSNFRSIKERQTLSFLPETRLGKEEHPQNLIPASSNPYGISLLKSVFIYGANASGKSNLLVALAQLRNFMELGDNLSVNEPISAFQPFLLDIKSKNEPCIMELDFIGNDKIRYNYKIEFLKDKVLYEALFFYPHEGKKRISKSKLFEKNTEGISFGTYYKGKKQFNLYPNQLVFSQARREPIESLTPVYQFVVGGMHCLIERTPAVWLKHLMPVIIENKSMMENLLILLKEADLGIAGIEVKNIVEKEAQKGLFAPAAKVFSELEQRVLEQQKIQLSRAIYEGDKMVEYNTPLNLEMESKGTLAMMNVGVVLLDSLLKGGFIAIDEIEQNLHPKLHRLLVSLFNSKDNNPRHAQMVFTTHDISLLDRDVFRLDQILFVEKNNKGESTAYRLSDFEGISKVVPLEKWYMQGRFGAIPIVNPKNIYLNFNTDKDAETTEVAEA